MHPFTCIHIHISMFVSTYLYVIMMDDSILKCICVQLAKFPITISIYGISMSVKNIQGYCSVKRV